MKNFRPLLGCAGLLLGVVVIIVALLGMTMLLRLDQCSEASASPSWVCTPAGQLICMVVALAVLLPAGLKMGRLLNRLILPTEGSPLTRAPGEARKAQVVRGSTSAVLLHASGVVSEFDRMRGLGGLENDTRFWVPIDPVRRSLRPGTTVNIVGLPWAPSDQGKLLLLVISIAVQGDIEPRPVGSRYVAALLVIQIVVLSIGYLLELKPWIWFFAVLIFISLVLLVVTSRGNARLASRLRH